MNKIENTVTKGEITRFEQFPLLSECFQKLSAAESVYMWERVKQPLVTSKHYGVGTQKKRLNWMIIMSTHNMGYNCKPFPTFSHL